VPQVTRSPLDITRLRWTLAGLALPRTTDGRIVLAVVPAGALPDNSVTTFSGNVYDDNGRPIPAP